MYYITMYYITNDIIFIIIIYVLSTFVKCLFILYLVPIVHSYFKYKYLLKNRKNYTNINVNPKYFASLFYS